MLPVGANSFVLERALLRKEVNLFLTELPSLQVNKLPLHEKAKMCGQLRFITAKGAAHSNPSVVVRRYTDSKDSVSGYIRLWSEYTDKQADLGCTDARADPGYHCPHLPQDNFCTTAKANFIL